MAWTRATRGRQVNFRCTEEEYNAIKATADAAELSVAQSLITAMDQAAVLAKLKLDFCCALNLLAGVVSRAEAYPPGSVSRPIRRAVELISITATLARRDELSARLSAPMPHECPSAFMVNEDGDISVPVEVLDNAVAVRDASEATVKSAHPAPPGVDALDASDFARLRDLLDKAKVAVAAAEPERLLPDPPDDSAA